MRIARIALLAFTVFGLGAVPAVAAPVDNARELAAIRNAAADEDPGAQLLLGLAHLEGRYGLPRNTDRAVYWIRRAARDGHPYAQLLMGNFHADGKTLNKDPSRSVYWWRQAAAGGNAEAQLHLGVAYLHGEGVAQDPKKAAHWFGKSADQGNNEARYQIGRMYYEGFGVPVDKERGRSLLQLAATQGHSPAAKFLELLSEFGSEITEVYQQSADQLIAKAKSGDPVAQYELGLRYESGAWDVLADAKQALYWLTKSAQQGNRHAMKALAHIYAQGELGTAPNPDQAKYWKERAEAPPKDIPEPAR